jgi:hypothetical protein
MNIDMQLMASWNDGEATEWTVADATSDDHRKFVGDSMGGEVWAFQFFRRKRGEKETGGDEGFPGVLLTRQKFEFGSCHIGGVKQYSSFGVTCAVLYTSIRSSLDFPQQIFDASDH